MKWTTQENFVKHSVWAVVAVLGCLLPSWSWAQNMIRGIQTAQQAGVEVLRIELSEPLKELPKGFTIQTPPRIAIDLPGVGNAIGRPSLEINQGNVRSAVIAQSGDRTRLVVNLRQASGYKAELQGNALVIVLEPPVVAAANSGGETVHFAPSQNAAVAPLREIDFRRSPEGAGRVVVGLPNNQVGVDIQQQGKTLVVEFLKSSLPAESAPAPGRDRLRHAGAVHHRQPAGRPRAPGRRAARRLGALRLPERQPVRARSARAEDRPEQAHARPRLQRRALSPSTSRTSRCARCCRSSPTSRSSTS